MPTVFDDIKAGRVVEDDSSVRPSGDTGFRFTGLATAPYVTPARNTSQVFHDQFHNSEIADLGPALNAVRFVSANTEAAAVRTLGYIRENIAHERAYQEKLDA